jgi:hypothetical protein
MWLLRIVGVERAMTVEWLSQGARRVGVVERTIAASLGTRRCRGSALAAAGGTVWVAICAMHMNRVLAVE